MPTRVCDTNLCEGVCLRKPYVICVHVYIYAHIGRRFRFLRWHEAVCVKHVAALVAAFVFVVGFVQ